MKLRYTLPAKIVNPAFDRKKMAHSLKAGVPYDEPRFITVPVGTVVDVDTARNMRFLVHGGQGEPFDDEAKAAVPEWNAISQEFLEARRDQLLCGHTSGDPDCDSNDGPPEVVARIRERLRKYDVEPKSEQPLHIMQAGLKLTNDKLKANANDSIRPETTPAEKPATVQTGQDSGLGNSDSEPDGE